MPVLLDEPQLRAVEHSHGPMLVLAGAGTGKTTVLVERVARLLRHGLAQSTEILAVTYTDNSAADLRSKVQERLPNVDCSGLKASTFHAYCLRLLKTYGRSFEVLDNSDLWIFLRRNLSELGLRHFIKAADPSEFLNDLLKFCDRCRDELVTASTYRSYVQRLHASELPLPRVGKSSEQLSREQVLARCDELAHVYEKVEQLLDSKNLGTFGDMIVKAVELLRNHDHALQRERAGARFILIDEFQDCNVAQIELATLLAGGEQNIFAVGDPDQAIYRFRGASSGAFQELLRRFPTAKRVRLERNHRSTRPILRAAISAISSNPAIVTNPGLDFERRQLSSARDQSEIHAVPLQRAPVEIILAGDYETEAAEVAEQVRESRERDGLGWSDFAVLFRQHAHRQELAEEFGARSIPVAVTGVDVLETSPVRDLMAALRFLQYGDTVSLLRIAALPKFNLSAPQVRQASQEFRAKSDFMAAVLKLPGGRALAEAVQKSRDIAVKRAEHITNVLPIVVERFGLDHPPYSEPLQTFLSFAADWEKKPITSTKGLAEFLEYLEYFGQASGKIPLPAPRSEADAVRLLSAHAAKGLEFKHVYVIRLNRGSFPTNYREPLFAFPDALRHSPPAHGENDRDLHDEEERRLFYVAITRARDSLVLCAKAGTGKKDPSPAGFLRELMSKMKDDPALRSGFARPYRVTLAASAQPLASAVAPWLQLPPARNLQELPLSATGIEMYRTCPLQFKIHHDWRLLGEASASMQFGNAMHSTLKGYFARPEFPPSLEQLLDRFKQHFARLPFDDVVQRELYAKQGIQQLTMFAQSQALAPAGPVLDTERSFQVEIAGVTVIGRLDRLDSSAPPGVVITDYKTGRPRTQKDADSSLQLSIYALAAERAWQLKPERLVFHNLENGTLVETSRSSVQLRNAEEIVGEVAGQIAEHNFEPTPGYHCRWCAYHSICPAQEQRLYNIELGEQALAVSSARVQ